jgi:hypothetical protein
VFVGEATDVMVMVGVCWCFCCCFLGLGSGFGGLAGCGLFLFLVQKVCPTTVLGAVADAMVMVTSFVTIVMDLAGGIFS